MKHTIIIILCLVAPAVFCQKPQLKVYVNTEEINKASVPVLAFVKANGTYHSILRPREKFIDLPEDIEFHKIEGLRFIVNKDTITFRVEKILEDLKNHPEKNMVDELYTIFKEINKWELRIDNFKYTSKDQLLAAGKVAQKRNNIYNDYKIYSLRTTSLKYYVVKA